MKIYGLKGTEYEGQVYTGEPVDCREIMAAFGHTTTEPAAEVVEVMVEDAAEDTGKKKGRKG